MEIESTKQRLLQELRRRYSVGSSSVRFVFAPYRICPLGAHIDHQLGLVTAMAIDQGVLLAYTPVESPTVRLASLNFPGEVQFDLATVGPAQPGDWGNYARGAVQALARSGHALRRGLAGMTAGRWSEGGLSSSAAVGVAYLLALEDVNALALTPKENIVLDQAIENDYLGLHNGILDQSGILLSRRDHLTLINCMNAEHRLIASPPSIPCWSIVLAFSGLKIPLIGTEYNRRVDECAAAARILLDAAGRPDEKPLLGHVQEEEYTEHKHRLPLPISRRAAHFFTELARVRLGTEAWRRGDLETFGRLMTASGESSIHNYECGCPPLIDLYDILVGCTGIYGARFSGAGFRGCCIGLVDRAREAQVVDDVRQAYARCQPDLAANASVALCHSADGARFLKETDASRLSAGSDPRSNQ